MLQLESFFGYDIKKEKFNVTEIIYQDDYEYAYKSFYQLIEVGSFKDFQARVYNKSKEIKWVQINSRIIRDGETEPRFAHGIVRDITEQKQQEAFQAQKQQLDAIVDNSTLGIVLIKEGKILKSNRAFQELIDYKEKELLGIQMKDVSFDEDEEASDINNHKLIAGEIDEYTVKKRYISKKGRVIWAKTNISIVRNKDNSVKYEVVLIEDITQELKKELSLKL